MTEQILSKLEQIIEVQKDQKKSIDMLMEGQKDQKKSIDMLMEGQKGQKKSIDMLMEGQNRLNIKVDENTQILRSLEHSLEVNKAEHDRMTYDIAGIKSDIKDIKEDMSVVEFNTAKNWVDIAKLKSKKLIKE